MDTDELTRGLRAGEPSCPLLTAALGELARAVLESEGVGELTPGPDPGL